MTQGPITIVYKSGPKEDLGNWRPITLLNNAYKILAKAILLRLKPLLADLVSPDQTDFVPRWFILDIVFVAHEVIDIAGRSKQPLLFLKVDFRKVFDSFNWDFLFPCMDKLGLGTNFINLTKLMFVGAEASVQVKKRI